MDGFDHIPGIKVGHAHNMDAATGCTVVLTTDGAVGGVDQRGGAPGSRETDLLRPLRLVQQVHAVLLAGGSAFGLAAADGVMRWLEARQIGLKTPAAIVPIVPAAVIYDLRLGQATVRPDADMGFTACEMAWQSSNGHLTGSVGAGTGATVGKILGPAACMKGGLGSATMEVTPGLWVGALMVVNCFGDVLDPATNRIIAGVRKLPAGGFADTMKLLGQKPEGLPSLENTVIGVVATNGVLDKEACNKVAQMAHNGLAQTIRPAHTMFDGDTIFALATGKSGQPTNPTLIGAYAATMVAQATINAIRQATTLAGVPAAQDI